MRDRKPYPQSISLESSIRSWALELGFADVGITDVDLSEAEQHLWSWLERGFHGSMEYMERHGNRRSRPQELIPGTLRVVSVRMDYDPPAARDAWDVMDDPELGFISRYALGRDYHKVLRGRLQKLADRISEEVNHSYRVFVDSAPVLEKPLAAKAGLGWIGKHSNLLSKDAGSWYFLGEIYTDLELQTDTPASSHCGVCTSCIKACPTGAIVEPGVVDSRLCISYLTIELKASIPEALRPAMGNRIYGCDDCQLVCPFNKFSEPTKEPDFAVRHGLDSPTLIDLFGWDEATFLSRFQGSAIRRIGHERWLRNIAVALGNGAATESAIAALRKRLSHPSELVREHVSWALKRLGAQHHPA